MTKMRRKIADNYPQRTLVSLIFSYLDRTKLMRTSHKLTNKTVLNLTFS